MSTLFAYVVKQLINNKITFLNVLRILPRNSPAFIISGSCVFNDFILTDNFFKKALEWLETCSSLNKHLSGKSVSLVLIIFDDSFKNTSVAFFVADLNLSSLKSDNFTFTIW